MPKHRATSTRLLFKSILVEINDAPVPDDEVD
jgi:hypothetical protein